MPPLVQTIEGYIPAATAAATQDQVLGEAQADGYVVAVTYTPDAAVTGTATNFRTLRLVNKGQAGAGTTLIASYPLSAGNNLVAADEKELTLSATEADRNVVAGDVLLWEETVTGTGIAVPGGRVEVKLARSGTPNV